jgi:hypothetical protein
VASWFIPLSIESKSPSSSPRSAGITIQLDFDPQSKLFDINNGIYVSTIFGFIITTSPFSIFYLKFFVVKSTSIKKLRGRLRLFDPMAFPHTPFRTHH